MEVFVYYYRVLGRPRDEVEDEIVEKLSDFRCEVTGSGAGSSGGNFDLCLSDDFPESELILAIARVLRELGFPQDTEICTEGRRTILDLAGQ